MRRWWCKLAHGFRSVAYAGTAHYECRRCGCIWDVPWKKEERCEIGAKI